MRILIDYLLDCGGKKAYSKNLRDCGGGIPDPNRPGLVFRPRHPLPSRQATSQVGKDSYRPG
jgi:hypothetical protein